MQPILSTHQDTLDDPGEHDDALLIRRICAKNRQAFEVLYHRYYRKLYRFIYRITRRSELVEEILNDTLFIVWKDARRFQDRSKVSTWIHGIAYRQALKTMKRSCNREFEELPQTFEPVETNGPDARLSDEQLHLQLQQVLDKLTPEHRAIVELTYYHGYSYSEIATILDCPENTVKSRMFYARERMRHHVSQRASQYAGLNAGG